MMLRCPKQSHESALRFGFDSSLRKAFGEYGGLDGGTASRLETRVETDTKDLVNPHARRSQLDRESSKE